MIFKRLQAIVLFTPHVLPFGPDPNGIRMGDGLAKATVEILNLLEGDYPNLPSTLGPKSSILSLW